MLPNSTSTVSNDHMELAICLDHRIGFASPRGRPRTSCLEPATCRAPHRWRPGIGTHEHQAFHLLTSDLSAYAAIGRLEYRTQEGSR